MDPPTPLINISNKKFSGTPLDQTPKPSKKKRGRFKNNTTSNSCPSPATPGTRNKSHETQRFYRRQSGQSSLLLFRPTFIKCARNKTKKKILKKIIKKNRKNAYLLSTDPPFVVNDHDRHPPNRVPNRRRRARFHVEAVWRARPERQSRRNESGETSCRRCCLHAGCPAEFYAERNISPVETEMIGVFFFQTTHVARRTRRKDEYSRFNQF